MSHAHINVTYPDSILSIYAVDTVVGHIRQQGVDRIV